MRYGGATWRRASALVVALFVAVLSPMASTATQTAASWTDKEVAGGKFTAGFLGSPTGNGCTFSGRLFTPRWTPAAAPSVAPTSYQYRLYWKPLIGAETQILDWTSVALGTSFTYTVPNTILQAGNYRYQVRAVSGSWTSAERTGTANVLAALGVISIGGCSWNP